MRSYHANFRRQQGQALMELTMMLLALMAITLGAIYICARCWSDNRALLSARNNAEKASRQSSSGRQTGAEIADWKYTEVTLHSNEPVVIPFAANDEYTHFNGVSSLVTAKQELHSEQNSETIDYTYLWQSPRDFNSGKFTSDFSKAMPGNAFDAAALVKGEPDGSISATGGLDKGRRRDSSGNMQNAFKKLFRLDPVGAAPQQNRSNQVYMPQRN